MSVSGKAPKIDELPNSELDQQSLEGVMENPFEKGFSIPFPKLFDLPLLRNGWRYPVMSSGEIAGRSHGNGVPE